MLLLIGYQVRLKFIGRRFGIRMCTCVQVCLCVFMLRVQKLNWRILLLFIWSKSKIVTNLCFKYLSSNSNISMFLASAEQTTEQGRNPASNGHTKTEQSFNVNRKSFHQSINTLKRKCSNEFSSLLSCASKFGSVFCCTNEWVTRCVVHANLV